MLFENNKSCHNLQHICIENDAILRRGNILSEDGQGHTKDEVVLKQPSHIISHLINIHRPNISLPDLFLCLASAFSSVRALILFFVYSFLGSWTLGIPPLS